MILRCSGWKLLQSYFSTVLNTFRLATPALRILYTPANSVSFFSFSFFFFLSLFLYATKGYDKYEQIMMGLAGCMAM